MASLALFVCLAAGAQDSPPGLSRAAGEAAGDTKASREQATRNAELALLVEELEAIVGHADLSRFAHILERPRDFVQMSRLVHLEVAPEGDRTEVEIEARVKQPKLRHAAAQALLPGLPSRPRVLVMLGERVKREDPFSFSPTSPTQSDLERMLRNYRFDVVDVSKACPDSSRATRALSTEPGAAIQLAAGANADVVVLAKATVVEPDATAAGLLKPRSAQVSIRILGVCNGMKTAERTFKATVKSVEPIMGVTQAIRDACAKAEGMLFTETVLAMTGKRPDGLLLVFEGKGICERMAAIHACLTDSLGAEDIEELDRSASGVRLRAKYAGELKDLASALTALDLDGSRLRLVRAVNGDMTFALEQ
ncbi:MAG: hypothetical protein GY851_06840 [bacterium]|nr:hypothetical protein [bacterium]